MLIKVEKLASVIDNLLLYSSFNIIVIAKEEQYAQRILNYLFRVSPGKFEVIYIDSPEKLLYVYRRVGRFVGVVLAETPDEFESIIEDYLIQSLTTYNYSQNEVDVERVKASIPDVIAKLNARYLFIDSIANKELEDKEKSGK